VHAGSVICIVDDDEDVRESIGTYFRSAGVAVRGFEAAEALLASPELARMGCLITDLHISGMDGLSLQRELMRQGRRVPVILMTAFPTPQARKLAEALGVSVFMEKPVDPEVLLDKVETLLAASP
jgi:FixJ family two-component response regulator